MDAAGKEAALTELSSRVIIPYMIITAVLVLVAIAIMFLLYQILMITEIARMEHRSCTRTKQVFFISHIFFLGVLALFLYVGVEVMAGDLIIGYGKSLGIALSTARYFTQVTLGFMLVGYIIGIATIPKYYFSVFGIKGLRIVRCGVYGMRRYRQKD